MSESFWKFLKDAAARFRAISASVRGHLKPTDLHSDAWIAAAEVGAKRGRPVDFSDPADREVVLNRVYWNAKGQTDWRLASAQSINYDPDGATPWADRLAAPESSSPLNIMLHREDALAITGPYANTYTQVAAYHIAITNLAYDELCARLSIAPRAVLKRVASARTSADRQWSLFDRTDRLDPAFEPVQSPERPAVAHKPPLAWEQTELQL